MSKWKKYIIGKWSWKRPLYSLSSIYLLLLIFIIFYANSFIFHPPENQYTENLSGFLYLENEKDEQVAVIYKKANHGMPTLLWSHGNAEHLGYLESYLDYLNDEGFGIIAYDYPGYGLSDGKPTEKGCYNNIQAVWNHLTNTLSVPKKNIFIIGQSVGTGPSVWLAEQHTTAGLVLFSPLKSINAVPFNINIFPYDRFPNIDTIKNVKSPLLVIHGDQDEIIDISHGKAVYDKHTSTKKFHEATGLGHNDLLSDKEVNRALLDFLSISRSH